MKQIDITTDKETYSGILLHEEKQSSFNDDFHVGRDWYSATSILLTNKGIVKINLYCDNIVPPVCDCVECRDLLENEPDCDPKTCSKCNYSQEEFWSIDTIISKEDIIKYLNK